METKNIFTKIKLWVFGHKVWSLLFAIVIICGGWQIYKSVTNTDGELQYVTTLVSKGTIISSISASGQVEATNQVDLKAQATGPVTYIGVKPGDVVKRGKLLFSINAKNAQKSVRNAETSLESAKLDLEKLKRPPETVDLLTLKQAIKNAEQSKIDAQKDVDKAYRDLLNTSTVATSSILGSAQTAPTITGTYTKKEEVVINISVYQTGSGAYFNASSTPSGVLTATGIVSTTTAQAIGDSGLYIKFASSGEQPTWVINLPNKSVALYETNYKAYQDALTEQKTANDTAELTILQKTVAIDDLYQPDEFELKSKELSVRQAEDNLISAKADLADYYVYAPFDGVVASVDAKLGETVSGTLGSIITNQKIASLSLNEVDVSKIVLGQKANVIFDALEDLSVLGTVAEIDTIGTVTQGVVSYVVKVAFDTDDSKIKPGMSVSASIILNSKIDVLSVPTSAIKNKNNSIYVEMFENPLPRPVAGAIGTPSKILPIQVPVVLGISDDTNTEIISGLKERDQIISKTTTAKSATKATAAPSLFGGAGGGGSSTRSLGR